VASIEQKAIYWIWLIYKDEVEHEEERVYLYDTLDRACLFDYAMTPNPQFGMKDSRYPAELPLLCIRRESVTYDEIREHLRKWRSLLVLHGLQYFRLRNEPPLEVRFKFLSKVVCF
jgi:hypothetical protein